MKEGPLAREPCSNIKVRMVDMKLHEDAIHRGPSQIYPAIREGIKGAMMLAGPAVLEPLQIMRFEALEESAGELSKLVTRRRGQLLDMAIEGRLSVVKAKMPVGEMFGLSNDLRSATNGRGTSSLVDQMFEKLPHELQEKIIREIRQRKGLTANE
jgi:elongation factor 2